MYSERIEIPHDILWKSLIEDIFPDFLRYFIPESDTLFDFSMGISFLDKELERLTDSNKKYRPKEYRYRFFDTEVIYKYHFLKLIDYQPVDFQANNNLFLIELETAWHGLKRSALNDDQLYKLKFDLCRRVLERGYNFQDFVKLFNFIKFYFSFNNKELFAKFKYEIRLESNQPKTNMGIVEAVETYIKQKAEEIGMQRGLEKGMEKGMEKGLNEGELKKAKIAIPKLFVRGMSVEDIADALEVSVDLVRQTLKASELN